MQFFSGAAQAAAWIIYDGTIVQDVRSVKYEENRSVFWGTAVLIVVGSPDRYYPLTNPWLNWLELS